VPRGLLACHTPCRQLKTADRPPERGRFARRGLHRLLPEPLSSVRQGLLGLCIGEFCDFQLLNAIAYSPAVVEAGCGAFVECGVSSSVLQRAVQLRRLAQQHSTGAHTGTVSPENAFSNSPSTTSNAPAQHYEPGAVLYSTEQTAQIVTREGSQIAASINGKFCFVDIMFLSESMQERCRGVSPAAAEHVDF